MGIYRLIFNLSLVGDLNDAINQRKEDESGFSEHEILDVLTQLCLALMYLEQRNLVHRDLKPHNVFRASSGVYKIGDFGISKTLTYTTISAQTSRNRGTLGYASPEVLQGKPHTFKSDIWGVGMIVHQLCTLK